MTKCLRVLKLCIFFQGNVFHTHRKQTPTPFIQDSARISYDTANKSHFTPNDREWHLTEILETLLSCKQNKLNLK